MKANRNAGRMSTSTSGILPPPCFSALVIYDVVAPATSHASAHGPPIHHTGHGRRHHKDAQGIGYGILPARSCIHAIGRNASESPNPTVYAINKSLRTTGRGPTLHHSRPCTSLDSDIQFRSTTAAFPTGINKSWQGHQSRADARTSSCRRMRCGCRFIILAHPILGRGRGNA